jgi:superfamily II DNA or RNA helicase
MGDAQLVGDVVDHWLKHAYGRKTIVFASNVAHSKFLCAEFESRGVAASHIDGYMRDPLERETIIDDFRNGGTDVLCNVAVLTKGFDAPECSCVVLARPTKSLMLHIQMIGRGLRLADSKNDCLILDHAGNILRNGLPTDDLPAELDDGTLTKNLDRKQKDKTLKECACSSCGFVSTLHKCPACGFAPERREDVEVVNGELREIKASPIDAKKRNRLETGQQKSDFYAGLLGYAKDRGYSSGWASHKYRERYGVWPNAYKGVGAQPPGPEVLGFIKHMNIRHAKSKAA